MKRSNTQALSEVLNDFFSENPVVVEKIAENRLLNAWETTLGRSISRYTERLYIKNKTLYVYLSSSVLRNELSLCRSDLIVRLNKEAGMDVIKQIVLS